MHRISLAIYIFFFFLPVPFISQAQTLPFPSSSTVNPSSTLTLKTEVSGFFLQGRKYFEVLKIEDLDTLVLPDGKRLIPLLRLLKALEISVEEKQGTLFFSPNSFHKDCP